MFIWRRLIAGISFSFFGLLLLIIYLALFVISILLVSVGVHTIVGNEKLWFYLVFIVVFLFDPLWAILTFVGIGSYLFSSI